MELITKEAARRVAQVVHHLPHIEVQLFVIPLARHLGLPITEEKLEHLTRTDLTQLFTEEEKQKLHLNSEVLNQVSYYLHDEYASHQSEPSPEEKGESYLQVAIASHHEEMIDGHFGSCPHFFVYQVGRDRIRLAAIRSTCLADEANDKNAARVQLIRDCALLYVQSIGGPAAAKVVHAGIHPVKFPQGGLAREALVRLQVALQSPPPWLAKVLDLPISITRYSGEE